jgi:hypothetical protein
VALRTLQFSTPANLAAFANVAQEALTVAVAAGGGGTGYQVGDILYLVGGAFEAPTRLEVTAEVGNVITGVSIDEEGAYSSVPSNPVSVTGGSGVGATFDLTWGPAIQQTDVVDIKAESGRWYLSYGT